MSRYIVERQILDGYLNGISNNPDKYLVDKVLPGTPGPAKGTILTDSSIEHFGGDPNDTAERLPGGLISQGPLGRVGSVEYNCKLFDRAYRVPDEDQDRSQLPLPLLQRESRKALHYLKVKQEQRFYNVLNDTAWVYDPGDPGNGNEWDSATGDPIEQIDAAVDALDVDEGLTMVVDYAGWNALSTSAIVRSVLNTSSDRAKISPERFLEAYGYERGITSIHIQKARKNTSGDPDNRSLSRIASGGWCWIGLLNPGAPVVMDTDLFINPTAVARVVEKDFFSDMWRDEDHRSDVVAVGHREAIVVVDTNLGALLTALLA